MSQPSPVIVLPPYPTEGPNNLKSMRHVTIGSFDLGATTFEAHHYLRELDKTFVGTPNYMGIAWFWSQCGVKHYLRDASPIKRRKVHHKWLKAGLVLLDESDEHYRILDEVFGTNKQTDGRADA
jgi:hypothetical protein